MSDAERTLDQLIVAIDELPKRAEGVRKQIAEAVLAKIRANIAAGRGPDGSAWPATKDGRKALQNAAAALSYQIVGTTVVFTLTGPEARHNEGWVKGGVQRGILPHSIDGELRARIEQAAKLYMGQALAVFGKAAA